MKIYLRKNNREHYSLSNLYETNSVENAIFFKNVTVCGKHLSLRFKCLRNVYVGCICQWNYFFCQVWHFVWAYELGLKQIMTYSSCKFYKSFLSTNCNIILQSSKSLG